MEELPDEIIMLAKKIIILKKQNKDLIDSFNTLAELLEDFEHNESIRHIGNICRKKLNEILNS